MRQRIAARPAYLRRQDRGNIEGLHRHYQIFGTKSYGCTTEIYDLWEGALDREQRRAMGS